MGSSRARSLWPSPSASTHPAASIGDARTTGAPGDRRRTAPNAESEAVTTFRRVVFGAHLSVAAEPVSHIQATVGCLRDLWDDHRSVGFRQPVTGYLLRQLVRERERDYPIILRTVLAWARGSPGLIDYIQGWLRGHFMLEAVLGGRR